MLNSRHKRMSMTIMATLLIALTLITLVSSLETTRGIALSDYDTISVSTCTGQGYDYFDSSSFTCQSCPGSNQEPDTSQVDGVGNYVKCKCKSGYQKISHSCSGVSVICISFYRIEIIECFVLLICIELHWYVSIVYLFIMSFQWKSCLS